MILEKKTQSEVARFGDAEQAWLDVFRLVGYYKQLMLVKIANQNALYALEWWNFYKNLSLTRPSKNLSIIN